MDRLLRSGIERVVATIRLFGETITYRRGASSATVKANRGRSRFEVDDGHGGVRVVWNDMDFLLPVEDLALDGRPTLPQRKDIIETASGLRYEVLAPGGANEWEYSDPYRLLLRIHTMAAS